MSFLSEWMARRHGGMARFYEKCMTAMERAGVEEIRARLAGDLTGNIIEIGCGTGLNFRHYRPEAQVIAIEPLDEFRAFAGDRAKTVTAAVTVVDGDAERLDFGDQMFDAGLETLVFCSVPRALQGLRELRRVLKPGAPARFFEHVRSERGWVAVIQDLANPVWSRVADGCNINRDTVAVIREAGFTIEHVRAHDIRAPRLPRFPMREVHARA